MPSIIHSLPGAYRLWRRTRATAAGRWLRRTVADPRGVVTRRRLERHARAAASVVDPSHAGEWPYLAELLGRLELLGAGFAIDLAAGDGVTGSCTLPLFRDHGWGGLALECDPVRFRLLAHAYRGFARVRLAGVRVTPVNVVRLLRLYGAPPEPTLLNLDVDSFDLPVAGALLAGFRPRVVDMEINEKVPPPLRFAVRYAPGHLWDGGHCYGCSLDAAGDILGAADYVLAGLQYNNAFFVRGDVARACGIGGLSAADAYRAGYRERPERHALFPWNYDMERLAALPAAAAAAELRRRFARYAGSFVLQEEPLAPGWDVTASTDALPAGGARA